MLPHFLLPFRTKSFKRVACAHYPLIPLPSSPVTLPYPPLRSIYSWNCHHTPPLGQMQNIILALSLNSQHVWQLISPSVWYAFFTWLPGCTVSRILSSLTDHSFMPPLCWKNPPDLTMLVDLMAQFTDIFHTPSIYTHPLGYFIKSQPLNTIHTFLYNSYPDSHLQLLPGCPS